MEGKSCFCRWRFDYCWGLIVAWVKCFLDGVQKTIINSSLEKQGERGIDQIKIRFPPTVSIDVNQKLLYIQDNADLTNLAAIYNLQGSVKDESGNNNHGTASNITFGTDSWDGKSATFNGSNGKITVTDSATLDFSAKFDIIMWLKWTATTSPMYVVSKRNATSNGWAICVNRTTAGDVAFHIGSSVVTSSTAGYNDGEWHMVRITRGESDLVTLYVDNISKGTMTNDTDLTNAYDLVIGYDAPATNWFAGSISRLRLYKGGGIALSSATNLYSKRNTRSTLKFGGFVTKIEKELGYKDVIAQSFGKVLGETEVRGTVFDNKTPEYIVNNLIGANTDLTYNDEGQVSGLTLTRYVADGKLIDIVRNFATLTNNMFYTTGLEEFFFIPRSFNTTSLTFTHGVESNVSSNGFDDTEIVNDLTVLGENTRYQAIETFNGNASLTLFILRYNAISSRVTIGGVEQQPEEDYILDTLGRSILFASPPASGTNNISVEYTYEDPLYFRGTRQSSIDTYGTHAKRLNMPWINNRTDGVRFVQSYLNRYKDVTEKIQLGVSSHFNSVEENDVVHIVNEIKGISGDFAIKSIRWNYPQMTTVINAGEYYFGFFESDKQIVEKLHDVESALTTAKSLRDYESPEEVLALTADVVIEVQADFTESLSITETDHVYEMLTATWGLSTYGSKRPGGPSGKVYTS